MQELAIASVPMQQYRQLYTPQLALRKGTLFAELYKPYRPNKSDEGVCSDDAG